MTDELQNDGGVQNEHASCEEKLLEAQNACRRALADYANLQRDVARERAGMAQFAIARAAQEFLPVYDHFKRALQHIPPAPEVLNNDPHMQEIKNWLVGATAIRDLFQQALAQLGVEEIKTLGAPFDPVTMESVGERDAPDAAPHTVIEEIESGYKIGERILKPAKVILAKEVAHENNQEQNN